MPAALRTTFSAAGTEAGGTTFDSASVTIQAGDTVYVMFASSDTTATAPTGVVWVPGSQSLTDKVADQPCGPNGRSTIWRAQGLTPGTGVFRGTWGGSGQTEQIAGGVALTGVDTTTPNGTIGTGTAHLNVSATATATTTSGQFVLGMCHIVNTTASSATTFSPTSGNNERFDVPTAPTGFDAITAADQTAAGSSTSTTWTISQTVDDWRAFAIPVNDAPVSTTLGVLGKRLWVNP